MGTRTASQSPGLLASGRRPRGNSSNAQFARFLDRQPSTSFRRGSITSTALRRFRGR